jgi:hypothetical protein
VLPTAATSVRSFAWLAAPTVALSAVPAQMWTNSKYVQATTNAPAPAGSNVRLTLNCGSAVTVTPAEGY